MSGWKVVYTGQAENDLRGIYEYIAFSLLAPETAKHQARRIMKEVEGLNHMPLRHKLCDNEPWRGKGLRILPVDNFIAFYLPVENQSAAAVIRIMYGGQDIEKELTQTGLRYPTS